MDTKDTILYDGATICSRYQVIDTTYGGRPARVLFSGHKTAAQSGIPRDHNPDMLFDYNQRLCEVAQSLKPKRILMVGGGAYTLPVTLLRLLPECHIDVVERDAGLDVLAEKYFGLVPSDQLQIFHVDGRTYCDQTKKQYDLIIIDAFIGTTIPRTLMTEQAFERYKRMLRKKGTLAMNVIDGYYGRNASYIKELLVAAQHAFPSVYCYPANKNDTLWFALNIVVVAYKGTGLSLPLLRTEELMTLEFHGIEAYQDE